MSMTNIDVQILNQHFELFPMSNGSFLGIELHVSYDPTPPHEARLSVA